MYYHHSPTTTNIKRLKQARAREMAIHLQAMKAITGKYAALLNELENLRDVEINADSAIANNRLDDEQQALLDRKITNKRASLTRKTDKITSV